MTVLCGHLFEDGSAGSRDFGTDPVAGKDRDQGVQGRVSSKRLISASSFCKKPS
jgi:hypothetical protein